MTAVGGIGARLRAGRERLGLTILQAAEKLHMDARILESLEAEDFAALGAQVYVRGHLRRYAELVGESNAQLNELYSQSSLNAQPDLTRIAKAPPSSGSNKLIFPALVVLAVFAVAGGVFWVLSLTPKGAQGPQELDGTAGAPTATPASGPTAPAAGQDGGPAHKAGAAGTGTVQSSSAANPAAGSRTRLASAGGPEGMLSGAAAAASGTAGIAAPAIAAGTPSPAATPPHSARVQQITLHFTSDSWAEVYDSAGQRLFYDVGAANSVRNLKGAPPFRIVLGNAPGVTLDVDGQSASFAKLTQADGTAEFQVTRSGHIARARPGD